MTFEKEKMLDWTNEFTFEFLEMYREEPAIWDLTHPDHKKKEKVIDAWVRLGERTGKSVQELKRKKDSLMATYRMHWRRKKASIQALQSGTGRRLYKPIWFAYEYMDGFLGSLYKCDDLAGEVQEMLFPDEPTPDEPATSTPAASRKSKKPPKRKRPPEQPPPREEEAREGAWPDPCDPPDSGDECELYGRILAKRLRRLPEYDRQLLMHDIDGMILEAMQRYQQSQLDASCSLSWQSADEPQRLAYPSPSAADGNHSQ